MFVYLFVRSFALLVSDKFSFSLKECRQLVQEYLTRLAQLADDVMNCSAVLNWLEVSTELCDWLRMAQRETNQTPVVTWLTPIFPRLMLVHWFSALSVQ